jgi:hypothetical protein
MPEVTRVDLDAIVREVIDDNRYMRIATADANGDPGVSPVYFAADGYRDFYWMSSPEVTHSRNIAMRPEVSIVLFDSRAPTDAVPDRTAYLKAIAAEVNDNEIEHALTIYPGPVERGGIVTADEVRPPAPYRLYRATVTEYFVLCPRSEGEACLEHGVAADHRTRVVLPPGLVLSLR